MRALLLDLAGGLDLGVLEVAVWAVEGHEDDFSEVWDAGEKEASDSLRSISLSSKISGQ